MNTRAGSAPGFTLKQLLFCTILGFGLIALLYPVFFVPRTPPGHPYPNCYGNLRRFGVALLMYTQDWDETYPVCGSIRTPQTLRSEERLPGNVTGTRPDCRWVAQLLPYMTRDSRVFACSRDNNPERNQTVIAISGTRPFRVSYGPNRLFVQPAAYGWKKPALSTASVDQPEKKYFLADCVTATGFDRDTIANVRYANYDPSRPHNGWTRAQFEAAGRVARPDRLAEPLTRHKMGSNILLADGHVKWLRHDQIPNNDGPGHPGFRKLTTAIVPWWVKGE